MNKAKKIKKNFETLCKKYKKGKISSNILIESINTLTDIQELPIDSEIVYINPDKLEIKYIDNNNTHEISIDNIGFLLEHNIPGTYINTSTTTTYGHIMSTSSVDEDGSIVMECQRLCIMSTSSPYIIWVELSKTDVFEQCFATSEVKISLLELYNDGPFISSRPYLEKNICNLLETVREEQVANGSGKRTYNDYDGNLSYKVKYEYLDDTMCSIEGYCVPNPLVFMFEEKEFVKSNPGIDYNKCVGIIKMIGNVNGDFHKLIIIQDNTNAYHVQYTVTDENNQVLENKVSAFECEGISKLNAASIAKIQDILETKFANNQFMAMVNEELNHVHQELVIKETGTTSDICSASTYADSSFQEIVTMIESNLEEFTNGIIAKAQGKTNKVKIKR